MESLKKLRTASDNSYTNSRRS